MNEKKPIASDKQADPDWIAQTIIISTASHRELKAMCIQCGLPYQSQPSAVLRQSLKQRLIRRTETEIEA